MGVCHTYAEFCILMRNSEYKSANLCGIPHYNTHAKASMGTSLHYNCLGRYMRRVRIIYLREIEKLFRTQLVGCEYLQRFSYPCCGLSNKPGKT